MIIVLHTTKRENKNNNIMHNITNLAEWTQKKKKMRKQSRVFGMKNNFIFDIEK